MFKWQVGEYARAKTRVRPLPDRWLRNSSWTRTDGACRNAIAEERIARIHAHSTHTWGYVSLARKLGKRNLVAFVQERNWTHPGPRANYRAENRACLAAAVAYRQARSRLLREKQVGASRTLKIHEERLQLDRDWINLSEKTDLVERIVIFCLPRGYHLIDNASDRIETIKAAIRTCMKFTLARRVDLSVCYRETRKIFG